MIPIGTRVKTNFHEDMVKDLHNRTGTIIKVDHAMYQGAYYIKFDEEFTLNFGRKIKQFGGFREEFFEILEGGNENNTIKE